MYYMIMSQVSENLDIQRHGLVEVGYFLRNNSNGNPTGIGGSENRSAPLQPHRRPTAMGVAMARRRGKLKASLPIKAAVTHVCNDNQTIRTLLKWIKPFLGARTMSRFQVHCGKQILVLCLSFFLFFVALVERPLTLDECHHSTYLCPCNI